MPWSVAFLITANRIHNDNHERLPAVFQAAGWRVTCFAHDDVSLRDGQVYLQNDPAINFDLIWPVGLGPRATFLDRISVLQQLPPGQLINPAASYVHEHGKTAWLHHAPETTVAHHSEPLAQTLAERGGDWVLKPAAGSLGAGVRRVQSAAQIRDHLNAYPPQYWLLQRYIPEIVAGEVRTLVCGDQIVASYLRKPAAADLRANLARDASAAPVALAGANLARVERVHTELRDAGLGFAAIDTVGGYLMEVNIANPGGLATVTQIYDDREVEAACQRLAAGAEKIAAANAQSLHRGTESSP